MCLLCAVCVEYFFFNDTATTEIYTLSLHDALPILDGKTRLGLGVLGAALVLGLLEDWLLRATPWGVNLFLWVAALVGAAALVVWRGWLRVAGEGRWLVPVALLFAACVAWRASAALVFLNVLAFLATASLALLRARTGRLRLAGLSEYLLGGICAAVLSSAGPLPVAAREVEWRQVAQGRWRAPALAATRGVFVAAPPLILFGALLPGRSEEHTSELQSRQYLVCRL